LSGGKLKSLTGFLISNKSAFSIVESPLVTTGLGKAKVVLGISDDASSSLVEAVVVRAESFGFAVVPEFLILVIEYPFFKTTSLVVAVEDERSGLIFFRLSVMKIHANISLHSGGLWLETTVSPLNVGVWSSIALFNLKIKVNVRVERDWLTAERRLSVSITPDIVGWARDFSLGARLELRHSKVPTFEDVGFANREDFWVSLTLRSRVSDHSVVHEVTLPVNSGPVTWSALITSTSSLNINTNSSEVLAWAIVLVSGTVRTENVRGSKLVKLVCTYSTNKDCNSE
jgi:hypothetical protein